MGLQIMQVGHSNVSKLPTNIRPCLKLGQLRASVCYSPRPDGLHGTLKYWGQQILEQVLSMTIYWGIISKCSDMTNHKEIQQEQGKLKKEYVQRAFLKTPL